MTASFCVSRHIVCNCNKMFWECFTFLCCVQWHQQVERQTWWNHRRRVNQLQGKAMKSTRFGVSLFIPYRDYYFIFFFKNTFKIDFLPLGAIYSKQKIFKVQDILPVQCSQPIAYKTLFFHILFIMSIII